MIDKGDIPSIQYKMSLVRPKAMKKVAGLSLIFTDFYVPALTPRLNSTETESWYNRPEQWPTYQVNSVSPLPKKRK
jgi:hypothetical protein